MFKFIKYFLYSFAAFLIFGSLSNSIYLLINGYPDGAYLAFNWAVIFLLLPLAFAIKLLFKKLLFQK